ncbi:MAG: ATP-dependent RecD-like DNA helicase [Dehalobacter sp.]|nr:ATP-dependent RecD-like DNA helicase [Dehalobacter sp.]
MATETAQSTTLTGTVTGVRFHNPQNGWSVLTVNPKNKQEDFEEFNPISVVGSLAAVRAGDEYSFSGSWKQHPQYGKQFQFEKAEVVLPKEKQGAIAYLATLASGVGLAKAKKIVDILGDDSLQKIIADPGALLQFDFLTIAQRADLTEGLMKNTNLAELSSLICREGVGMGTANRIYTKYGAESAKIVKENPYILADEVYGIGFKVADRIGLSVNIAPDSPYRVEAAYQYALKEAGNDGHVFLRPRDTMIEIEKLLGKQSMICVDHIRDAYIELEKRGVVHREGDAIYLTSMHEDEVQLAHDVMNLAGTLGRYFDQPPGKMESIIENIQEKLGVVYAKEQKEAIINAFKKSLSVVTGGPGTGKTTVIKGIIEAYLNLANEQVKKPSETIMLAAPTGRAAKRMAEATGIEAKTIHRLLRYNPFEKGFEYNAANPLPSGLLIVDEFSMCDLELSKCLFESVSNDMVMIIVGDVDQLPSVGPGKVLEDIIESRKVITTRLKFNYRQASGSRIALEASRIAEQDDCRLYQDEQDWKSIMNDDPEQALERIKDEVRQAKKDGLGIMEFQVLAPMKKGIIGVDNLNEVIREIVNPSGFGKAEYKYGKDRLFRLNDKIMVMKNNYNLGVFNGDIGIIQAINGSEIRVNFDGEEVTFNDENVNILTLAYASTVHKSQGSEFPLVIMVVMRSHYIMLQKNLFYTGITRAKDKLILVCQESAVKRCLSNKDKKERYTMLRNRLINLNK